jgi:hypothetical protein
VACASRGRAGGSSVSAVSMSCRSCMSRAVRSVSSCDSSRSAGCFFLRRARVGVVSSTRSLKVASLEVK